VKTTRKGFIGSFAAAVAAVGAVPSVDAAETAGSVRTDGKKPLVTVQKGLGGGKVLCLSNRSYSQMASTVFVSPSGRVAVVDGGHYGDADGLRTVLAGLGGKVDYCFFTHAHEDHYGALTAMLERQPDLGGIKVGKLLFSFPDSAWLDRAEPASIPNRRRLASALAKAAPKFPVVRLAKGQVWDLGDGWTFEVLNDFDTDLRMPNINDTSICLSVRAGGRKWLMTGDLAVQNGERLVKTLGSKLEHEFVYMAHHGQQGTNKDFYAAVKPKTAIWPTPDWLWENNAGKGPGSGPFTTNYTKCWLQELGVKEHHVLVQDVLFV